MSYISAQAEPARHLVHWGERGEELVIPARRSLLVWLAGLGFVAMVLYQGQTHLADRDWMGVATSAFFTLMTLWTLVLTETLRRETLRIRAGMLEVEVRHGPWVRTRSFHVDRISQLHSLGGNQAGASFHYQDYEKRIALGIDEFAAADVVLWLEARLPKSASLHPNE